MKVLEELHARYPDTRAIKIALETGTLHGETTRALAEHFEAVHTIELGDELYLAAVRDFADQNGHGCIYCHHGNSSDILPRLIELPAFQTPVLFYLDAHWFHHAGAEIPTTRPAPLLAEVEAIGKRPFADVVVVDDCQHMGVGWLETDSEMGKLVDRAWRANSPDVIANRLGRVKDVFTVTWKTQHMIFIQEAE